MKQLFKTAAFYAVLGLLLGVFYREFTKFNAFTGTTAIGFLHVHTLVLGMFLFLILIVMEKNFQITQAKTFKPFMYVYNSGLLLTIIMMMVRGIPQVLTLSLNRGADAAISGIAGIGHILLAIGLFLLFKVLYQRISE